MPSFSENIIIFLFAWSILLGTAYNTFVHYDFSYAVVTQGYISMAKGDYDINITRRYRVLVPWTAAAIAYPMQKVMGHIWPHRADTDWAYRLAFLIVNSILMAFFGLLLYRIARCYGLSPPTAIIGMLAVLSSRWANYATALPLTDSLYWLLIALLIYTIKKQNISCTFFPPSKQSHYGNWLLITALVLGPLSKESFILLLPLPLLFSTMPRWQQVCWMAMGLLVAFAVRYWLDHRYGLPMTDSVHNALSHSDNILLSIKRIFALRGIGELMTVLGGFSLILLSGFWGGKNAGSSWLSQIDLLLWLLLLAALIHAIISSSVARMLFLASPFWIVALGSVLEKHPLWHNYRQLVGSK